MSAPRPIHELLQELFLTAHEVAQLSRRHYQTVLRALRSGELHGVQYVDNGTWHIPTDAALRWMDPTHGLSRPQGRPPLNSQQRRAA